MKVFVFTLLVFVMGDFAVNHGDARHYALHVIASFAHWMASAGSESIFSR